MDKETEIEIIRDLTYKTIGERDLKLDIYMPKTIVSESFPAVIFIHGGGWINGDKEQSMRAYQFLFKPLIERGLAVVAISYRLADRDTRFPTQLEDCKDAVKWIKKNAGSFNLDEKSIGIVGASAGGHLGLLLGMTPDMGYSSIPDLVGYSSDVRFVVALYPPTDLKNLDTEKGGYFARQVIGGSYEQYPEMYAKASPVNYLDNKVPPILLIHGELDLIVPLTQSVNLFRKGKDKGKHIDLLVVKNARHGAVGFKDQRDIDPSIEEIIYRIRMFIRKHSQHPF